MYRITKRIKITKAQVFAYPRVTSNWTRIVVRVERGAHRRAKIGETKTKRESIDHYHNLYMSATWKVTWPVRRESPFFFFSLSLSFFLASLFPSFFRLLSPPALFCPRFSSEGRYAPAKVTRLALFLDRGRRLASSYRRLGQRNEFVEKQVSNRRSSGDSRLERRRIVEENRRSRFFFFFSSSSSSSFSLGGRNRPEKRFPSSMSIVALPFPAVAGHVDVDVADVLGTGPTRNFSLTNLRSNEQNRVNRPLPLTRLIRL